MGKLQKNDGFTMIEMILTLFIVSIILLSTVTYIPKFNKGNKDDEIKNIEYLFQNAQIRAKRFASAQYVEINHRQNKIVLMDYKNNYEKVYNLSYCSIYEGGLNEVIYYSSGNTSRFGTITLNCNGEIVKIIFQIQKGRYRIERWWVLIDR